MTDKGSTVAAVLERDLTATIERWLQRVGEVDTLTCIPLSYADRTGHLPRLIRDVIARLRVHDGEDTPASTSAHDHGKARFLQGYSVPMLVEESRLLQVSIFDTLHRGQSELDLDRMMLGVMIIADECDAQLKHTVETFMELEKQRAGPCLVPKAS